MRPNILIGSLWALGWCTLALGQTNPSRPSSLRDSGVISRAAPPTNFPTLPGNSPSSSAMSDQAWTSPPPAAAPVNTRLSDNSSLPAVVSAEHTTSDPRGAVPPSRAVRQTSAQALASGVPANGHEPKPLKPPTTVDTKDNSRGSTGTVQMFISVLSSLAIVIGLIFAAAWFYRKAAPTISGSLPKQVVQVLGRTPLAPRQQLVLLRLGSKLVLVSNLHGEVRTISEITDPLEVDRLSGLCESAQPGSISESFRSVLHNMGRNG